MYDLLTFCHSALCHCFVMDTWIAGLASQWPALSCMFIDVFLQKEILFHTTFWLASWQADLFMHVVIHYLFIFYLIQYIYL